MTTLARELTQFARFATLLEQVVTELDSASVDELIHIFQAGAIIEGKVRESRHDSRIQQQRVELSDRVRMALFKIGDTLLTRDADSRNHFLKLLQHDNEWVRLQAAALAIKVEPQRATATLEALVPLGGLLAAEAGLTLRFAPGGPGKFPKSSK